MHILYVSEGAPDAYLTAALAEAGHVVEIAAEPEDGLAMAAAGDYQAILLDWAAPPADWTRRYASAAAGALLIVIAAEGDERRRAAVLRTHADACFIRPLPFAELEARLQALWRVMQRAAPHPPGGTGIQALQLSPASRAARWGAASVVLSGLEFRLLEHLMQHAGDVIPIAHLRQHIWGEHADPASAPVHACAARLRRKLASLGAPGFIHAVAGHGYVFRG